MNKKEISETKVRVPLSQRKLTYFEATINLIKCIMGAGILGGPYGFRELGWLLAFITASFVIFIIVYCTRILINCMHDVRRLRELDDISYADAVLEGFKEGPIFLQKLNHCAQIFVKCFLVLYHFNCGPVYIVIICHSIRDVVIQYFEDDVDVKIYMVALAPLIMIIYLVNNIKAITPFSVIATTLILTGLSSVVYYILSTKLPPFSDLSIARAPDRIPMYVGMILLTSASPGVVLAIERVMKNRKQFMDYFGVLNVAMTIIYLILMSFSLMGYWRYGENTEDNILLTIPDRIKISQATKVIYAIAIYFSYPLQLFPVVQIMWTEGFSIKCRPERRFWYEMLLRIGIVIASTIVAVSIPFFHIIASLNGCIAITMLGMAVPALLDICLRYPDKYGPIYIALIRDIFLILFGIFFCLAGIISSIVELIDEFKK